MIVKVISGNDEYYFSGEKIKKGIVKSKHVEDAKASKFFNPTIIEYKTPNAKFKLCNKVSYTMFETLDSKGETIDVIITLNCDVYIMNNDGKTIDKFIGISFKNVEFED